MFALYVIYLTCLVLIWWTYIGYIFYLLLYFLFRRGNYKNKSGKKVYPSVAILIPVYQEKKLIREKIINTLKLKYPGKMKILLIDGGSTDGTISIMKQMVRKYPQIEILETFKGKINQLNYGLRNCREEIIFITDVDAVLPQNAIVKLTEAFLSDENIGVVGAYVLPDGFSMEKEYWQQQNQLKLIESRIYSSTVVAPCYGFRRSLIKQFPDDCLADDIYISLYALTKNKLTKYISSILVLEKRSPRDLAQFLTHKFRKANAFAREILRFLYLSYQFNIREKIFFLTKFLQFFILPFVMLFFLLISINLLLIPGYRLGVIAIYLFLFINMILASLIFNQKLIKINSGKTKSSGFNLRVFFYTNLVLSLTILVYFFYNQQKDYEKIE